MERTRQFLVDNPDLAQVIEEGIRAKSAAETEGGSPETKGPEAKAPPASPRPGASGPSRGGPAPKEPARPTGSKG